ncbi:hypothetical protein [Photobacterium sp. J15]|uniref:hypothetical protein n=1 Tax=Photobacterium sp. J15 TaxID=265901 RepID=UPI0007E2E668|nr:hypothetical protein [Photobacterium sp. J15]
MKKKYTALVLSALIASPFAFSMNIATAMDTDIHASNYENQPFHWQMKHWLINDFKSSDYGDVIRVTSPFYSNDKIKFPFSSGSNYQTVPDFYEEDGWEMLDYNLGFNKQTGQAKETKDYSYPYVLLYNRARAVARIIAYINHPPYTYNSVELTLTTQSTVPFTRNRPYNLFGTFKPAGLDSPQQFASSGSTISPLYAHDAGQFVYGDIPITFDPCATLNPLNLVLNINMVQSGEIQLGGRSFASATPVIASGQYAEPDFLASYLKDGQQLDVDALGVLTYRNYGQLAQTMQTHRFAKAVYKTEGNEQLNNVINGLKAGFTIVGKGAEMVGVPLASTILGKASEGLGYIDVAPKKVLDGFELPDESSYISVGELALKGNAKVISSVRPLYTDFPNSLDTPKGSFSLKSVPEAEYIPRANVMAKEFSYLTDNGYTLKGAMFWGNRGPKLNFTKKQLVAFVPKGARSKGIEILVGLEARTERTSIADGMAKYSNQPKKICDYFYCSEQKGEQREIISSKMVPIDQWEDTFGRNTVNFSLPSLIGSSNVDYRNIKLYLKVMRVPTHLLEKYDGDITQLDRETLSSSITLQTYPIKLTKYALSNTSSKVKGHNGGFEMVADGEVGANLRHTPISDESTYSYYQGDKTYQVEVTAEAQVSDVCSVRQ